MSGMVCLPQRSKARSPHEDHVLCPPCLGLLPLPDFNSQDTYHCLPVPAATSRPFLPQSLGVIGHHTPLPATLPDAFPATSCSLRPSPSDVLGHLVSLAFFPWLHILPMAPSVVLGSSSLPRGNPPRPRALQLLELLPPTSLSSTPPGPLAQGPSLPILSLQSAAPPAKPHCQAPPLGQSQAERDQRKTPQPSAWPPVLR